MKFKMKKNEFEEYLFNRNNEQTLDHAKYVEHTPNKGNVLLHLYYNNKGHIGTWQKGGDCCIFEERLPN